MRIPFDLPNPRESKGMMTVAVCQHLARSSRAVSRLTVLLGAVGLFACTVPVSPAPSPDYSTLASKGTEMMRHASGATNFAWVPVAKLQPNSVTSLRNAVAEASTAVTLFAPTGCLTASAAGNVLTYLFVGCTGMGERDLYGEESVTFDVPVTDEVQLSVITADASVEEDSISAQATAWVRFDATGQRLVRWNGTQQAVGNSGEPLQLLFDLNIQQDDAVAPQCNILTGSVQQTTTEGTIIGNAQALTRCGPGACPKSGVLVLAQNGTEGNVTVTYDGTASPAAVTSAGTTFRTPLSCSPQ